MHTDSHYQDELRRYRGDLSREARALLARTRARGRAPLGKAKAAAGHPHGGWAWERL